MSIALANGVSPVLAIISRDLLGLKASIGQIENQFGRWAAAAGGIAAIIGGSAMLGGMAKLVEHGRELVHQQELMRIAGMNNQEIAEATAKAYATSAAVQTTTISENLRHLRELRYAFGNLETAQKYLDQVAKANTILNAVKGGAQDQVWELVKSLEQKGETINPADFMKYVDIMTQAVISTGGRVTPQQFFQAFKYGRTAMLGWDETFVGQYLPRLIQSMSGSAGGSGGSGTSGPGNALMSAFAKVVQGQMPKTAAEQFAALGLADSIAHIRGSSQSQIKVHGRDLFQQNPYEWVQSVLMPALTAHGITTQNQIIEAVSRLFPVRTASQIIAEMGLQGRYREGAQSPFEKDAALARAAMSTAPAFETLKKLDPDTIMKSFHQQWKAMLEALGSPLVQPAMEVMKSITNIFTAIGQFAGAHPEQIKLIAEAIAAIGVALVAIGALALGVVIAGLVGIPGAIAAVVAALGTLAYFEWDRIKSGIAAVVDAISSLISSLWNAIKKGIQGIPNSDGLPIHPGSYHGSSPGSLLHKTDWIPSRSGQPIIVHTRLDIDGRRFAQLTSEKMADYHAFPKQAPFYDGQSGWAPPDFQVTTT